MIANAPHVTRVVPAVQSGNEQFRGAVAHHRGGGGDGRGGGVEGVVCFALDRPVGFEPGTSGHARGVDAAGSPRSGEEGLETSGAVGSRAGRVIAEEPSHGRAARGGGLDAASDGSGEVHGKGRARLVERAERVRGGSRASARVGAGEDAFGEATRPRREGGGRGGGAGVVLGALVDGLRGRARRARDGVRAIWNVVAIVEHVVQDRGELSRVVGRVLVGDLGGSGCWRGGRRDVGVVGEGCGRGRHLARHPRIHLLVDGHRGGDVVILVRARTRARIVVVRSARETTRRRDARGCWARDARDAPGRDARDGRDRRRRGGRRREHASDPSRRAARARVVCRHASSARICHVSGDDYERPRRSV